MAPEELRLWLKKLQDEFTIRMRVIDTDAGADANTVDDAGSDQTRTEDGLQMPNWDR